MEIRGWNRDAWSKKVADGVQWTIPVAPEVIARARRGDWHIILTPVKPIPAAWLGDVKGKEVLCLAGAGGQQAPVLAAAGARVTVLDNCPAMLDQDRLVADREGLEIDTVEGDMADLGTFGAEIFDLIVHPVSNCFVPDLHPVWRECFRVLRPGARLLAGFMNPAAYIFDFQLAEETGELKVINKLPYADSRDLPGAKKEKLLAAGEALEFSHTLEDQLAGQLAAGLVITGFYEDRFGPEVDDPLTRYMPTMLATCALKPGTP